MTSATPADRPPFPAPDHTAGPDRTVVCYGSDTARHVLSVYLDPRCPYCKRMENGLGAVFQEGADEGRFRIEYHFATFLDEGAGGSGSLHALSALGAALDEGSEPFAMYLRLLYAEQPPEDEDLFADTGTLLRLGSEVPGLDSPDFRRKVSGGTYVPWAERVSRAFTAGGVESTPTVLLDGANIAVLGPGGYPVTPEAFYAQLPA